MNVDFETEISPPPNNLLVPDIYNKLDAEIQERTRVFNTLLDKRLMVQEKVLNKYRHEAEVVHNKEAYKIRRELSRIRHSLPTVGHVHGLNVGLDARAHKKRKINPLHMEKRDMPFCERHLLHFMPNKRKYYKRPKPPPEEANTSKDELPPVDKTAVHHDGDADVVPEDPNGFYKPEVDTVELDPVKETSKNIDDLRSVANARTRIERRLRYSSPAKL